MVPAEELEHFSEVLMNVFEAGLGQDLLSKFTTHFPIRAFIFFFRDKGGLNKQEFSRCKFPEGGTGHG